MAVKGGDQGAAKFVGVQLIRGSYSSVARWNGQGHYAGEWPSAQEAAIARDRLLLHLQAPATRLQLPELSLPLGAAASHELRRLARLRAREHKDAQQELLHRQVGASQDATQSRIRRRGKKAATTYAGVSFIKGMFHSVLMVRRQRYCAGTWLTEQEAVLARDRALLYLGAATERLQMPEQSRLLGAASPAELRRMARLQDQKLHRASPYLGVVFMDGAWRMSVQKPRKAGGQAVGGYRTAEDAAWARDRLALHLQGDAAMLNFPERSPQPATVTQLRMERRASKGRALGVHAAGPNTFHGLVHTSQHSITAGRWPTWEEAIVARDRLLLHLGRPTEELARPEQSLELGAASSEELMRLGRLRFKQVNGATSRYIGVQGAGMGRWRILVERKDRAYSLSGFRDEDEAAEARDRLTLYVFGKRAVLNFPDRKLTAASVQTLRREVLEELEERDERSSRYYGVMLNPLGASKPWLAVVVRSKKIHQLGAWKTPEDAAIAHDRAALHYGGPRPQLNFPERAAELVPADAASLRAEARRQTQKGRWAAAERRKTASAQIVEA